MRVTMEECFHQILKNVNRGPHNIPLCNSISLFNQKFNLKVQYNSGAETSIALAETAAGRRNTWPEKGYQGNVCK